MLNVGRLLNVGRRHIYASESSGSRSQKMSGERLLVIQLEMVKVLLLLLLLVMSKFVEKKMVGKFTTIAGDAGD